MQEVIPYAGLLRYRNTGTEAVMAALAAERAFTQKSKVVKFYGAYHGVWLLTLPWAGLPIISSQVVLIFRENSPPIQSYCDEMMRRQ